MYFQDLVVTHRIWDGLGLGGGGSQLKGKQRTPGESAQSPNNRGRGSEEVTTGSVLQSQGIDGALDMPVQRVNEDWKLAYLLGQSTMFSGRLSCHVPRDCLLNLGDREKELEGDDYHDSLKVGEYMEDTAYCLLESLG